MVHNRPVTTRPTPSLIGTALSGRFFVEQKIGEELLGSVYMARDQQSGAYVHVKVLHPHFAANQEKFARFGREITATQMVKHPNTVNVVAWGEHDDVRYLVLEAIEAHSLADELANGPMDADRAALITAQITAAVGAAHQEGIVHRNLSPHNVLLLDNVEGDYVKVRDFGLSKLDADDGGDDGQLTQVGARVGNTHYMAPEYIEEGKVHPKGDVYAVGGLLYHMLCGAPPYEGRAGQVLTAHVANPVPVPSRARPELPAWCDDIVGRMMGKHPNERPGAYQVPKLLEQAVGHSLATPSASRPGAPPAKARAEGKASGGGRGGAMAMSMVGVAALSALAAAVLVGGIAIAGFAWWQSTQGDVAAAPASAPVAAPAQAPAPPTEVQEAPPTEAAPSPKPRPKPAPAATPAPAPAAAPAPVGTAGRIDIRANERALVYVDGAVKGYTPLTLDLAPGTHEVAVALPGKADSRQVREVAIGADQNDALDFRF